MMEVRPRQPGTLEVAGPRFKVYRAYSLRLKIYGFRRFRLQETGLTVNGVKSKFSEVQATRTSRFQGLGFRGLGRFPLIPANPCTRVLSGLEAGLGFRVWGLGLRAVRENPGPITGPSVRV